MYCSCQLPLRPAMYPSYKVDETSMASLAFCQIKRTMLIRTRCASAEGWVCTHHAVLSFPYINP